LNSITKRILTSLVAAPGVLALLYFAKHDNFPWAVGIFLALSSVVGTAEFADLMDKCNIKIRALPTSVLAGAAFMAYSFFPDAGYLIGTSTLGVAIAINLKPTDLNENAKSILAAIMGLIYLPGLLHYFYLIYIAESGILHAINLLLIVWGYDSGAYLFGKFFGTKKIAPEVSPNKTLEGVFGGLIVAFIGASISVHLPEVGTLRSMAAARGDSRGTDRTIQSARRPDRILAEAAGWCQGRRLPVPRSWRRYGSNRRPALCSPGFLFLPPFHTRIRLTQLNA